MAYTIEKPTDTPTRMSMILWGDAGVGKTTLAATAPGRKLFLMLDPDGDMSIRTMSEWERVNLSGLNPLTLASEGMKAEPFGIAELMLGFDTLIVDSLTKFSEYALAYSISYHAAQKSTLMSPGLNGYGGRNICVANLVSNLLRITAKMNKHIIFTTHERADTNDSGNIVSVSMMLGGQLPNMSSKDISEVWNMHDDKGKRMIYIRPDRLRAPVKSRMFDVTGDTNFEWKYNSNTGKGPTIAEWWERYTRGSYAKLPLPK